MLAVKRAEVSPEYREAFPENTTREPSTASAENQRLLPTQSGSQQSSVSSSLRSGSLNFARGGLNGGDDDEDDDDVGGESGDGGDDQELHERLNQLRKNRGEDTVPDGKYLMIFATFCCHSKAIEV